nr:MobA/MobL family protein [Komagataeibacter nataicola]
MTQAQGIALARDFVREQFVERGMVADLNVHWDIGEDGQAKPHAHVMLSTRRIEVKTGEAVHGRRDGIPHPERGGRGAYNLAPDPGPDGAERDDDPLKLMIRLLTEIRETQRGILLKLSTLEKRLQRLEEQRD